MKNKSEDLKNALFAQLERMADEDLDLEEESVRTKGIVALSQAIVNLAKEEINYQKLILKGAENGNAGKFFEAGTKEIGN